MTDPQTILSVDGAPNLAIDVQPDELGDVFVLDDSFLDDTLDRLGWANPTDGPWLNVACDVTRVTTRRGATRLQGPLTRAEAGQVTIELLDTERRFDPLMNADAIHAGTPVRLRAWDILDELLYVENRRNLAPNPLPYNVSGWTTNFGVGGAGTTTVGTGGGPFGGNYVRATWTTASTAVGGGQVRVDGRTSSPLPIAVTPGTVISAAIYARTTLAQRLACQLTFFDATGSQTGITPNGAAGPAQVLTAGAWTRLAIGPVTVPAGATRLLIAAQGVTGTGAVVWPVGASLDGACAVLEVAPVAGSYFDGDSPSVGDQTVEGDVEYWWTTTAGASPSVRAVRTYVPTRWDAVLMTASIDDVPVIYPREGSPQVTLVASDVIDDLAAWSSVGRDEPGTGQGDTLRTRIDRVLAETGVPATISPDSDTAFVATLAPSKLAGGWSDITAAADAELGRVWVDASNRLVIRGRESELSGPVRGTLSDWHGEEPIAPHCCYNDLAAALGTEGMANRAIAARRVPTPNDGSTAPTSAVVQLDDTVSQSRYRKVVTLERRTLELDTDDQLEPWAGSLLTVSSRPELRIDSVTPAPWGAGGKAWQAACRTDIGDRWLQRYHPELGPTVLRAVGVLGIEHTITPDSWEIVFTTVEAPEPDAINPSGWLTLDVSTLDDDDLFAAFRSAQPWRPGYDPAENVFGLSSTNLARTYAADRVDALRVLTVGDSITYGQGVSATQAWPAVLPSQLTPYGITGTTVLNVGVAGTTSGDWATPALPAAHTTFAPTVTTIALGTNDAVQSIGVLTYTANLTTLVRRYKALGDVLLIAPPPHQTLDPSPYVQACYKVAATEGVPLLDLFQRWGSWSSARFADSTHPNATGYGDIAYVVARALSP